MRDKIISFILWLILWWIIVFGYTYYKWTTNKTNYSNMQRWWSFGSWNTLSDEQLERMSTRLWISKEELKKKIDSWEDVRSLMRNDRNN